ncbi:MAG: acetyl-CoA carboxylase, carboxyltransferase subunit beta [Bdellovibrionota bacterium]
MSAWFLRGKAPKPTTTDEADRLQLPGGLWEKCPGCAEIIYSRELTRNRMVCPKCNHHFRLSADQRINLLCDRQSFEELDTTLRSTDPLSFKDTIRYRDRLKRAEKKTSGSEAVRTGRATMNGRPVYLGIFDFAFLGGSMGVVVGEKLTRIAEHAVAERAPLIIVSASGGARMQEGIYSLMQMAKVTAALVRLGEVGVPYISVLTDPTTGGVAASFAMLGDINIAEPGALICFAGPRVIEQTIRSKLPEGFQRSEFLLDHGMVDLVIERSRLRDTIVNFLDLLCAPQRAA